MNNKKNPENIYKDHRFSVGVGEGTLSDIVDFSAVELSDAIKDKVVSCVDVMKSYLAQIDFMPHVQNITFRYQVTMIEVGLSRLDHS